MKLKRTILGISLSLASFALAGEEPYPAMAPAPAPAASPWFLGGSVGYLFDYEQEIFTLHLGKEMDYQLGGWNPSVYLEVGYTEPEDSDPAPRNGIPGRFRSDLELEIIPLTLNYHLDRPLTDRLDAYIGFGAGVAFFDAEFTNAAGGMFTPVTDDDVVFCGQIFAGLSMEVTPSAEVYGGVRWIYFDDPDFNIVSPNPTSILDLETDDLMVEIGARIRF